MNLQERFIQHLKKVPFVQKSQKQLVAVSGGVDSVVLCDLMSNAGYEFMIAHCNFQLRGEESERDEQFVKELGAKYKKEVLVKKFETKRYAEERKLSIQVAARELRYEWFNKIVNGQQPGDASFTIRRSPFAEANSPLPTYIITAHHANDSIETMLMNFFKGTGIAGLHGILPVQGNIFRPLLFAKKDELLAYANEHALQFAEDSSNASDKYTRNFFRHHLFPTLKEVYPTVEDNLLNNIERFKEAEELYKQSIELHKKKLLEVKGSEVYIPVLKLKKASPLSTIVYEIVKAFGFTVSQLPDILKLLDAETGKYVSSSTYRVIKNRAWLIISPVQTEEASNILIEGTGKSILYAGGKITLQTVESSAFHISNDSSVATVDLAEITFPLLLRKCKQGDYFYPLGMKKKKKLSRFFTDRKLSKTAKENVWVLEMDKKIIWVVGQRIDDRFKVTDTTQKVLKISAS